MSKFLYFEPEDKAYRKTSILGLVIHEPPTPPNTPEISLDALSVDSPTTSRAESVQRAYGLPEVAARLRRRGGGTPRYRRIRPGVASGQDRMRATRAPRMRTTTTTGGGGY